MPDEQQVELDRLYQDVDRQLDRERWRRLIREAYHAGFEKGKVVGRKEARDAD